MEETTTCIGNIMWEGNATVTLMPILMATLRGFLLKPIIPCFQVRANRDLLEHLKERY